MNSEILKSNCPVCNNPIVINKQWIIKCNKCEKELSIIHHNGEIVSIRVSLHHPNYYIQNDLSWIITDLVNKNLSPEQWGFSKNSRFPNENQKGILIYDSKFCRVKFVLESSDYFPQHDIKIFYGRLHAPDIEDSILWNGKNCYCWHRNIPILTIPFIEGISPQQLVETTHEVWDALMEKLKVNYPSSDMVEYPLRLHAKIWEHYKEKLFSIFDLRNSELWEEYSTYTNEYNEAFRKRHNLSLKTKMIC